MNIYRILSIFSVFIFSFILSQAKIISSQTITKILTLMCLNQFQTDFVNDVDSNKNSRSLKVLNGRFSRLTSGIFTQIIG